MPHWVRELRRRRRYSIPVVIWFAAVALFIAVWIYVALQTSG
jgi:predicted nucleic acid-binding Zn ribbon protein